MKFKIKPIEFMLSDRKDAIDNNWKSIKSFIELTDDYSQKSLDGLIDFFTC